MCKLVEYLERKADEGAFVSCTNFLNGFVKRVGKVLVIVVYFLTLFLSFTSFAIIIPFEQLYKSAIFLGLITPIGVFLMVNIVFHYHMARTLAPVAQPGREGDKWCPRCEYWKSDRTHHCSICEKCVLGMDHHCIWINQCVGSHNHRHFFLFIFYLSLALFTIVSCGTNSIWNHLFIESAEHTFCTSVLYWAPLQEFICERGELARNCVIFCYFISALLLLLVGGLTIWNIYLISKGYTYIDYLNISDIKNRNPHYRNPLDQGFNENWKNFLGLRRNRTFLCHVLIPSSHPPIVYYNYSDRSETV